ncbi:hypothetical protein BB561_006162 [Smittium simulii]|uniref:Mitochondrial import inner membrane translocase subunit TIM50 n=1 Tax=Smittium simulii TaxID=133385 RepID=A0A2T9Y641_9FUNG|nr:hypothetical protein BB561_006162 [Smittium simulii]
MKKIEPLHSAILQETAIPSKTQPKKNRFRILVEFVVAFLYTSIYKFISWIPFFYYIIKILPDPNTFLSDDLRPLNITTESNPVIKSAAEAQVHHMRAGIIDVGFKPGSLPMEPENKEAREFTKTFFNSAILRVRRKVNKPNSGISDSASQNESSQPLEVYNNALKTLTDNAAQNKEAPAQTAEKVQVQQNLTQYNSSRINYLPSFSAAPLLKIFGMESSSKIPKLRNLPVKALAKKYLVLDLDETLIHSSPHSSYKAHLRIEVIIEKMACLYYIYKRPYLDYFLRKVSEWYKIVIFTASIPEYANPVLNFLDPSDTLFDRRLFRD